MQTSRRRDAGGNVERRSSNSTAGVTPNNIQSTDVRKEALAAFHVDLGPVDKQENKPLIKGQNVRSPFKSKKTPQQKMMAVAFYWVCSLCLVFINKSVMDGDVLNLDAPLFMSWTQFIMTVICCAILGKLGQYYKPFSFFPPFEYKLHTAKKVLPLTLVFLGMIVFNNLCLKHVEVSFYLPARSMTIPINIVFTFLILRERTSCKAMICCLVIIIGYLMGCDGEVDADWLGLGVIFGLISSVFVALNCIFVKKILPVVDDNSEKLMIYNNVNAVLLLPIIILICTSEVVEIMVKAESFQQASFWAITVIAGIFGFLINFASYIQIKYTSPLTHNVSGNAKAAVQTVLALYIFQNPTTAQGLIGCAIVIIGSFAYSRVK